MDENFNVRGISSSETAPGAIRKVNRQNGSMNQKSFKEQFDKKSKEDKKKKEGGLKPSETPSEIKERVRIDNRTKETVLERELSAKKENEDKTDKKHVDIIA